MKKFKLLFILAVVFTSVQLNATVWRVNNVAGVNAPFTTLQAAHNSSSVLEGDTLYLEASAGSYGDLIAIKKLVIIGAGYFLNENLNLQANGPTSEVSKIAFNNGSQGSVVAGCTIYEIKINTSDLVIERNNINFNETSIVDGGIFFNTSNVSNIIIRNNFLQNNYEGISSSKNYVIRTASTSITGINNIIISKNFISTKKISTSYVLYLTTGFSGTIENNVIYGNVLMNNAVFNNNILRDGTFTASNCTYNNNIGNSTQFGITNGNQQNVTMTNVFLGATGNSTDSQWQLKVGSPAIGAGVGGVDCGMFGGTFPYVLSGIPAIPAIYFHEQIIDNVNQQLNVTIKAKSHN